MLVLLFSLFAAACLAPFLILRMGRPAFGLLAAVPLGGFFWLLGQLLTGTFRGAGGSPDAGTLTWQGEWMPTAHLDIILRMDGLSALFGLIVLGIGGLVLIYCWGYFDTAPRRLALFGGQLTGFAAAMFGLIISDSLLLMYVFWEVTSLLSFMLVSYYGERASSRRAAQQALMITVLGGLAMLMGIIGLGKTTGQWTLSGVASLQGGLAEVPYISASMALLLAGALTKSAIAPAHFWLPGAMAAPTPVSAYLHSAAMVKAGIYLVARLAPEFQAVDTWYQGVIPLGLFTMLLGGWMALKQRDLKLILAYGTVSQLGFITAVMAIGSRPAMQAALTLTVAHALFKAVLFMVVGAIDHAAGTRDIGKLSGLARKEPILAAVSVISAASMAGIPPLLGFIAKEAVLETVLHEQALVGMPGKIILVALVVGSVLTMAYALRFLWGAFAVKPEAADSAGEGPVSEAVANMHGIGPLLLAPPALLTAGTVLLGLWPAPLSAVLNFYLDATFGVDHHSYLALWHGFTLPLAISALIIAAGALMHWQRALVARAQLNPPALGSADDAYDAVLNWLRVLSLRFTATTQRGSLQFNLATIFVCLILIVLVTLLGGELSDVRMIVADNPWQAMAALIIIGAAVAATVLDNRLSALIVVGLTGYGLAFIFALHGAPDLALTQLLVETIVMVIFMLTLRKMPAQTKWRGSATMTRLRAWLSVGVGLAVTLAGLFAINARSAAPISEYMPKLAQEIGHGANTVNVLLVDIRAWDTFGEGTVLVIAGIGVASLIFRTQSFARVSRRPTLQATGRRWLAASAESEQAQNRALMVEVSTRLLFPSMMALSLYFFFAGHNAPGGGFAGGLVAALALTLRYLAGGREELEEALPIDAARLLGAGLLITSACVIVPVFLGYPPLTTGYTKLELWLVGPVSLPTALIFDAGVYLTVVGLAMHILNSLGAKLDIEEDMRKQRARDRKRALARKLRVPSAAQGGGR